MVTRLPRQARHTSDTVECYQKKHGETRLNSNVSRMSIPFKHKLLQIRLHEFVSLFGTLFACLCLHHPLHNQNFLLAEPYTRVQQAQ